MSKLDQAVEPLGESWDWGFEVHTQNTLEPDIDCVHLTEEAKEALRGLMKETYNEALRLYYISKEAPNLDEAFNMAVRET